MVLVTRTRRLLLARGWMHDPYTTHYRITKRQARGLTVQDIPRGVSLHIDTPEDTDCPHCSTHIHPVLTGLMS